MFISVCLVEMETGVLGARDDPINTICGALLPEHFTSLLQDFCLKPFNTELLAKAWHCSSAAGLPVQPAGLPKAAHCVLGQWGLVRPMISFLHFSPHSPHWNYKSQARHGAEEAEMTAGSTLGKLRRGIKRDVMRNINMAPPLSGYSRGNLQNGPLPKRRNI